MVVVGDLDVPVALCLYGDPLGDFPGPNFPLGWNSGVSREIQKELEALHGDDGKLGWLVGEMVGRMVGRKLSWLVGEMVGWMVGRMAGRKLRWMDVEMVCWMVGWMVGRMTMS